jgi:hypothetical protein
VKLFGGNKIGNLIFWLPLVIGATGKVTYGSNKNYGSHTSNTFSRLTTKDSYTWNITHNTESAAVWDWKLERWGSPLVQEKYRGEKVCDRRQHTATTTTATTTTTTTTTTTNNNNNNNNLLKRRFMNDQCPLPFKETLYERPMSPAIPSTPVALHPMLLRPECHWAGEKWLVRFELNVRCAVLGRLSVGGVLRRNTPERLWQTRQLPLTRGHFMQHRSVKWGMCLGRLSNWDQRKIWEIWGSRSGVAQVSLLPRCYSVSTWKQLPKFRPASSGSGSPSRV